MDPSTCKTKVDPRDGGFIFYSWTDQIQICFSVSEPREPVLEYLLVEAAACFRGRMKPYEAIKFDDATASLLLLLLVMIMMIMMMMMMRRRTRRSRMRMRE